MKRVLVILAGGLAALLLVFGMLWQQYHSFLTTPLSISDKAVRVQVERGATIRSVIRNLERQELTQAGWRWRLLTRMQPVTIKAGEYLLPLGLNPQGLLNLLSSGDVIRYHFTVIEGWTYRQLLVGLANDPVLIKKIPALDGAPGVLEAIGAEIADPEGWFLPETYQYIRGDSDLNILQRAHQAMKHELEASWDSRSASLPLDKPYGLLTLASIVEKESGMDAERAEIAGVFVRRLESGWRLETDPTVIYGLGQAYDGDIRRRDLDTDTPYNTYTRFGLPPTPIALPGKSSLRAAARPAQGTSMFFVASGSGGHVFSDTLEEHNAAVQNMLRRKP